MRDEDVDFIGHVLAGCGLVAFFAWCYISKTMRWHELADLYSDGPFVIERSYSGVSFTWGWYEDSRAPGHGLTLGKEGLRLDVWFLLPMILFRWRYHPILIPWNAIESLQEKPASLGCDRLNIKIAGMPCPLRIHFSERHGDAISLIQKYWEKHRVAFPQPILLQSKSNQIVSNRT